MILRPFAHLSVFIPANFAACWMGCMLEARKPVPRAAQMILSLVKLRPTVIRGNASEILALAGAAGTTKGVDSTARSDEALEAGKALAEQVGCIVAISGAIDLVCTMLCRLFAASVARLVLPMPIASWVHVSTRARTCCGRSQMGTRWQEWKRASRCCSGSLRRAAQ